MSINISENTEPTWKYFTRDEFKCSCGNCENLIQNALIDKLDKARGISGVSYKIPADTVAKSGIKKLGAPEVITQSRQSSRHSCA